MERIHSVRRRFISKAKSSAVRRSCTLAYLHPDSGSAKMKILHVPLRTYSESVFLYISTENR